MLGTRAEVPPEGWEGLNESGAGGGGGGEVVLMDGRRIEADYVVRFLCRSTPPFDELGAGVS